MGFARQGVACFVVGCTKALERVAFNRICNLRL